MAKGIFILGNGFDLDLGLATSYSDFAKSKQWDDLMDENIHSVYDDYLLGFLRKRYQVENWIDIEAALLEYAVQKTKMQNTIHANEDRIDFNHLRNSLKSYLLEQQSKFVLKKSSLASAMLMCFGEMSTTTRIYTFNYTLPEFLAWRFNYSIPQRIEHIHGSLRDADDIILGVETQKDIDDRYAFLYKTQNRHYRHTDIMKDLRDKDEYIFFGHSLNGMDYEYFRLTFSLLAGSSNRTPRLTIITKDVNSEEAFKVFLRKERISLQGLYSNANPTFILTDEIYKNNGEESEKVAELLNRMKEM